MSPYNVPLITVNFTFPTGSGTAWVACNRHCHLQNTVDRIHGICWLPPEVSGCFTTLIFLLFWDHFWTLSLTDSKVKLSQSWEGTAISVSVVWIAVLVSVHSHSPTRSLGKLYIQKTCILCSSQDFRSQEIPWGLGCCMSLVQVEKTLKWKNMCPSLPLSFCWHTTWLGICIYHPEPGMKTSQVLLCELQCHLPFQDSGVVPDGAFTLCHMNLVPCGGSAVPAWMVEPGTTAHLYSP